MLDKSLEILNKIASSLSAEAGQASLLTGFAVYIVFILVYSGFFWNFHKIISKRDFRINFIERYFDEKNEGFGKAMKWFLRFIKYLIVFPAVILFWFLIFSLFLLILSKNNDVNNVLLIAAAVIISIRILVFSQEDLSRNISKIIPFTLLGIFIISPSFSDLPSFLIKLNLINDLVNNSQNFLIFIFLGEIILRSFHFISIMLSYAKSKKDETLVKKPARRISRSNKNSF